MCLYRWQRGMRSLRRSICRDKLIVEANASLAAIDRDTSELAKLIELIGIRSV